MLRRGTTHYSHRRGYKALSIFFGFYGHVVIAFLGGLTCYLYLVYLAAKDLPPFFNKEVLLTQLHDERYQSALLVSVGAGSLLIFDLFLDVFSYFMQRRSFVVSGPIDANVKKEWTIRVLAICTLFLPAFICKGFISGNQNPSREILAAYLTRNYRWILSVFVTNMSLTDTFDHTLLQKVRTWMFSFFFAAGTLVIIATKFMKPSIVTLILFYLVGIISQFAAGVANLLLVCYHWRQLWKKTTPFTIKEYSFMVYSIPFFWVSLLYIAWLNTDSSQFFDASITNMLFREIYCLVATAIISLLPTRYSRHKSNALQVPYDAIASHRIAS